MRKHLQQKQLFINKNLDYNAISTNTIYPKDTKITKFILYKKRLIKRSKLLLLGIQQLFYHSLYNGYGRKQQNEIKVHISASDDKKLQFR